MCVCVFLYICVLFVCLSPPPPSLVSLSVFVFLSLSLSLCLFLSPSLFLSFSVSLLVCLSPRPSLSLCLPSLPCVDWISWFVVIGFYTKRVLKCIFTWWQSLIVLRWSCAVDRTSESSYWLTNVECTMDLGHERGRYFMKQTNALHGYVYPSLYERKKKKKKKTSNKPGLVGTRTFTVSRWDQISILISLFWDFAFLCGLS